MATLYEIDSQIKTLLDNSFRTETGEYVDRETGEVFDAEALDALQVSRKEKIEGIGRFILNLESDAAQHYAEGDRQYEKGDAKKRKAERLRAYLAEHMRGETYHGDVFDIGWTRSQYVEIENVDAIPDMYKRTVTKTEPDKRAIKAAYQNGKTIPGASLQVRESLKVK